MPDIKYVKRMVREAKSESRGRTVYPIKLKNMIVEMLQEGGDGASALSKQLGINQNVMTKWVKNEDIKKNSKLMPVTVVNEPRVLERKNTHITLEKENGLKIHLPDINRSFLVELLREL